MPLILGAIGAMFITLLRTYLPGIVGRLLLAFGVGLATYNVALPALTSVLAGYINALPPVVRLYVGALGIDLGLTMIFSAFAAVRLQRVFLAKLGTPTP